VSPDEGEDARVWVGRIGSGHEAEHAQFINWLNGPEAGSIFRRRRLNEYVLREKDGVVTVVFKAPHTGDPRIMIDFLRYPGLWPDYWEFVSGGRLEGDASDDAGTVRVHWRREPSEP
jgi:hypothetical protein